MNIHFVFIGEARAEWNSLNIDGATLQVAISPGDIHLHDIIIHPLLPGRELIVLARLIDLKEPAVTLLLDLHSGNQQPTPLPGNVHALHKQRNHIPT